MVITLLPDEQDELLIPLKDLHSLQDAHIPGADLAQRPLREAQVVSLAMADPATWPKILLTRTKEVGLVVIDGYHRREAGTRRQLAEIRATIRAFANENAVIEAAFEANLHHGIPASATTRSDYAYWLFCTYPDLPQKEIAQRVGIKPSTVNIAIKRRVREHEESEERSKRRTAILWRQETQEQKDAADARDKQIAKDIRAYVRLSKRLYHELESSGDSFTRHRALNEAIREEERMDVWRMAYYMVQYVKDSLPAEFVASLSSPAPSRSRRTKSLDHLDTEASNTEQEQ
jgi:Winged helix-turn-helix DNA-binding